MPTERFERQLPELFTELAAPRTPDYLDDLLWQTANTSQRPAWSFLERWLPMFDVARQPVAAPPMPWRTIGFGFVLLALLIAMVAALVVGGRPNAPAPFGPARNGLVAYSDAGDIYTVDPAIGVPTAIVTGPEIDLNPKWSRDGTRLAFERKQFGASLTGAVFVASADGADLVQLTPEPVTSIMDYNFSPDGAQLLIAIGPTIPTVLVAASDGSWIQELDLGRPATNVAWRPPNGAEILFMDQDVVSGNGGLYVHDLASGQTRTIFEEETDRTRGGALWSPDGSRIAYMEWVDAPTLTVQVHIIGADGTGERVLPLPPGAEWQAPFSWSNDGTRIIVIRGYTGGWEDTVAAVVPADGSGYGVEIVYPGLIDEDCCPVWEWAPDDSVILGTPVGSSGLRLNQVLIDPVKGTTTSAPWTAKSPPTWQRLAR
jgi:hypothetical protein